MENETIVSLTSDRKGINTTNKKQEAEQRKARAEAHRQLKEQRRLEREAKKQNREAKKAEKKLAQQMISAETLRFKAICTGFKHPKTKSASPSPKETKYNIETMLDFVKTFPSHKAFMSFLNLVPISDEEKTDETTTFIKEYKAINESEKGASYPKVVRYLNYTTYQHSYVVVALFNHWFGNRVQKYDRLCVVKGIPGWAMKNDDQRKEIIARRKEFNKRTDLHQDIDLTSLDGDSLAQAEIMEGRRDELANLAPRTNDYEYSIALKDSYVNTFIINLVKMKRTRQEVSRTYGCLQSYAYKYARYGLSATKEKSLIKSKIKFLAQRLDHSGLRPIIEELSILEQFPILMYRANDNYKLMNRNISIITHLIKKNKLLTALKKDTVPTEAKPILFEALLKAYKKAVDTWKVSE